LKQTEEKVIKFIRDYNLISPGDKILIALSGGADSVFLTYFLHKFKKKYKITLGALHINHMLRGKNASADEKFCKAFCSELSITYLSSKKNVKSFSKKNKVSLEEAGRVVRYKALERTAKRDGYSKIATAHNSNDNAETVLLNLIKGTGLRGFSGIPISRGRIIRPILVLTREEIIAYLTKLNILYRTDETNTSNEYERNFLRNEIIPVIKQRLNPSFEDAVLHSSAIMKQHYAMVQSQVDDLYKSYVNYEDSRASISELVLKEGEAFAAELIKTVVERNFLIQLSFKDVTSVSRLFNENRGNKVNLPEGITAWREKGRVVIFKGLKDLFTPLMIKVGQSVKLTEGTLNIQNTSKSGFTSRKPGEEYIAADDADETFQIRKWKSGDKFYPIGMRGSKKVSDFLNEKKVDAHSKKDILLLTNRDRIVWIIGMRLDNRFRITDHTERILKICLK
jgi:tRNA(Ile)-lysidine synthase